MARTAGFERYGWLRCALRKVAIDEAGVDANYERLSSYGTITVSDSAGTVL